METKDTFERVAALSHYAMGTHKVKVIFREGGHLTVAEQRERGLLEARERAYWMDLETYGAIPLGVVAFIADYKAHGAVVEAQNTDIYDIENN